MNTSKKFIAAPVLALLAPVVLCAQQAQPPAVAKAPSSGIQKNIETYLRDMYAFGAETQVTVGAPKETDIPGLLETKIDVKVDDNLQSVKFYVSKDGKYLIRGELSDMTKDPLAENRSKLQIKDAPSSGNPNGSVTMVEFSDFECPVCRSLHDVLQGLLVNYPQVHLVFKDFPLEQHPWARLAAIGGRCAYTQDPQCFLENLRPYIRQPGSHLRGKCLQQIE